MLVPTQTEAVFDRILQIAVEVFAEYGFRDATVREICTRANVNVASVNYYFRSKEALYGQALAFAFKQVNGLYPQAAAEDKSLPPARRLAFFIDNFLHKLLDDSQLGFYGKMITREIADPTKAFDDIITTMIVPQCQLLEEIVRLLLDKQNPQTIDRCVLGILGQCLMFKHSRSIIDRLYPQLVADAPSIQACAEHITQFSLSALNSFNPFPEGASS